MYDPVERRWTTPDPIGFEGDVDNPYRYAGNHPTNAADPSGLYEEDIHYYMTNYLARAAGLGNVKLNNTQAELRKRGGKAVSPAYAIAWFAQHVDDNRLTTPLPSHIGDVKRLFNDDVLFWHFYAIELNIKTFGARKGLIEALQKLGGKERGKIKGAYFKTVIPLPVTSNSEHVQELVKRTMNKVKGTNRMPSNSDAMFGMTLHTYEDSWSHAGFQMPFGHGGALYGGHAPDLPWLEQDRATQMAEQVYNRMREYAKEKYGIDKPMFEWGDIKTEVAKLMKTGMKLDSPAYQKGDKATHEKDLQGRIKAWKEAIDNRFHVVDDYEYTKPIGGNKDEWNGVFEKSIADVKPDKAPFVPTITNIEVFVQLIKEAYGELEQRTRGGKLLPEKERPWLDLLHNVYIETQKIAPEKK